MSTQTDFLAALTSHWLPRDILTPCDIRVIDPSTVEALFFPHSAARNNTFIAEARAICESCPVRLLCLEAAYEEDDQYGIRGGLTADERRQHRRSA